MIDKRTLKNYPRPAWLPDWTDPGAYIDHGHDAAAWAWEFLRRNPEYQADFAHYWSVPWCYPEGGKTPKLAGRTYNDDAEMCYFFADPPVVGPTETVGEYRQRTGIAPVQLETHLLNKWGVVMLNDPAMDVPVWFASDTPMPPFKLVQGDYSSTFRQHIRGSDRYFNEWPGNQIYLADWPEESDGFMQIFAFDVRLNLDDQMLAAKMMLQDERLRGDPTDPMSLLGDEDPDPVKLTNRPKTRINSMKDYLRVFDAVWTEGWERRQEIAAKIWRDKGRTIEDKAGLSSVDRAIEQAIKLVNVNGGYRDLVKWASLPKT